MIEPKSTRITCSITIEAKQLLGILIAQYFDKSREYLNWTGGKTANVLELSIIFVHIVK